jgi:uncharacterized protein YodC (DUF2158 family)
MMEFKVGDVVKLKSGGPEMTVSEVDDDEIECVWFPQGDFTELRKAEFIDATLEKVK